MGSIEAVFDWYAANIRHLARHAISPAEVEQCYRNDPLILEEQFVSGELRYLRWERLIRPGACHLCSPFARIASAS